MLLLLLSLEIHEIHTYNVSFVMFIFTFSIFTHLHPHNHTYYRRYFTYKHTFKELILYHLHPELEYLLKPTIIHSLIYQYSKSTQKHPPKYTPYSNIQLQFTTSNRTYRFVTLLWKILLFINTRTIFNTFTNTKHFDIKVHLDNNTKTSTIQSHFRQFSYKDKKTTKTTLTSTPKTHTTNIRTKSLKP